MAQAFDCCAPLSGRGPAAGTSALAGAALCSLAPLRHGQRRPLDCAAAEDADVMVDESEVVSSVCVAESLAAADAALADCCDAPGTPRGAGAGEGPGLRAGLTRSASLMASSSSSSSVSLTASGDPPSSATVRTNHAVRTEKSLPTEEGGGGKQDNV